MQSATGAQHVDGGLHPFQVDYFTDSGVHVIFEYSGPDTDNLWQVVPEEAIYNPPAFCCSMACKANYRLREDSEKIWCASKPCLLETDNDQCCEPEPQMELPQMRRRRRSSH